MYSRDSELEAQAYRQLANQPAQAAFLLDEERVLDADEISAELVPEQTDVWQVPAPAAIGGSANLEWHVRRIPSLQPSAASQTREQSLDGAAGPGHGHEEPHALALTQELERLRKRMRARDAYLVELEQALDQSTRQLTAAGLTSVDDVYRLLGRVRGQAFRIAELESELRTAKQALSPKKPRLKARPITQ